MRRRASIVIGLVGLGLLGAVGSRVGVGAFQEDTFPHARHQGLFPLCTGCHEGIPTGDRDEWYPEVGSCSGCHDGVERRVVVWNGPSGRIDNVDFDHSEHGRRLAAEGDPDQACANCHIPPGGGRMQVSDQIQLATCWSCHEHQTEEHFDVDASCERCHVPLAGTSFPLARIERLPKPRSHESESFIAQDHGQLAPGRADRCATCHTREKCASCHVDVDRVEIAALPPAPAGMTLPEMTAHYPEPASHLDDGWLAAHQLQASVSACNTCHTTDDCRSCHVANVPDVVAALPRREDVVAPGVMLSERSPDSHASMFFMQSHPVLASADQGSCQQCHVDAFCVSCHEAEPVGGYHPANFMIRHSASAYGRDTECATCHEEQRFCRACHVEVGLTGQRVALRGFHDGSPVWLLQHGQAARQNLESCSSCHKQIDCTRCHGVLGAFKVSPHSAGFDAERAWARSPRTCLACHVGNPLNGDEP